MKEKYSVITESSETASPDDAQDGEPESEPSEIFQPGETHHRIEDIHERFGGNRYSGISPCANHPYTFIFFGESGEWHGYDDELREDGSFLYTGEGREGDMEMSDGNAAIRNHHTTNDELHVFEIEDGAWEVTYVGQYQYKDHHWVRLPDQNDEMRDAIRFELVPAGGRDIDTGVRDLADVSVEELYELAEKSVSGAGSPQGQSSSRTTYRRSEVVKRYALERADGICQGCDSEAPFLDENETPFLEVHHMKRRSDGGVDHPDNVVALCPNCHRRVHHGKNGDKFNETLIQKTS